RIGKAHHVPSTRHTRHSRTGRGPPRRVSAFQNEHALFQQVIHSCGQLAPSAPPPHLVDKPVKRWACSLTRLWVTRSASEYPQATSRVHPGFLLSRNRQSCQLFQPLG